MPHATHPAPDHQPRRHPPGIQRPDLAGRHAEGAARGLLQQRHRGEAQQPGRVRHACSAGLPSSWAAATSRTASIACLSDGARAGGEAFATAFRGAPAAAARAPPVSSPCAARVRRSVPRLGAAARRSGRGCSASGRRSACRRAVRLWRSEQARQRRLVETFDRDRRHPLAMRPPQQVGIVGPHRHVEDERHAGIVAAQRVEHRAARGVGADDDGIETMPVKQRREVGRRAAGEERPVAREAGRVATPAMAWRRSSSVAMPATSGHDGVDGRRNRLGAAFRPALAHGEQRARHLGAASQHAAGIVVAQHLERRARAVPSERR